MPALAAIPAIIGAGMAIKDAVDGPENGNADNLGQHSETSKSPFYSPMGQKNWGGLSGIHGDWQGVGKVATPDAQGVYSARGQRYGSRADEARALGLLQQYATGEKSAARAEAANAIDQLQSAVASQAATYGNSPAAQHAAMYAGAAAGQNVAGQTAAAAAKEQLAAQQAYAQGMSARRQGDLSNQLAEQQWWQQQGAFGLGKNAQMQSALGMGMQQAENERNARMRYEMMLRGQSMDQQKLDEQKRGTNITNMTNAGVGVLDALSSASAGSDKRVKQGVRNATPDDVFGFLGGGDQDAFGDANNALVQRDAAKAAAMKYSARPEWLDLYDPANQDVFSAGPYDQNWDAEAVQRMGDFSGRAAALGRKQAAANANAPQLSEQEWLSQATNPSLMKNPDAQAGYQRVPTMQALNNLQGLDDRPVPGTWGNSTLNSIQQLVGSDEKVKQGIRGLSDQELAAEVARRAGGDPVKAMLNSIEAKSYTYKDPSSRGASPGRQVGVMAQDLEKTPAGAALVTNDGPGGTKMVDYGKAGPLAFAALAQLNDRLNRLERGKVDFSNQPLDVVARGENFSNQPLIVTGRPPEPQVPRPTSGRVAIIRGGQPVPGSNLETLAWLQSGDLPPAERVTAEDQELQMLAYQNAIARGLPPPGMTEPMNLADRRWGGR